MNTDSIKLLEKGRESEQCYRHSIGFICPCCQRFMKLIDQALALSCEEPEPDNAEYVKKIRDYIEAEEKVLAEYVHKNTPALIARDALVRSSKAADRIEQLVREKAELLGVFESGENVIRDLRKQITELQAKLKETE